MRLEDLESIINSRKVERKLVNKHNDVVIKVAPSGREIYITIYKQGKAHFDEYQYWNVAFVADVNRLYIVYATKDNGYKWFKNGKNSIGRIQITDRALNEYLRKNNLSGGYDWCFDAECNRKYIDFQSK